MKDYSHFTPLRATRLALRIENFLLNPIADFVAASSFGRADDEHQWQLCRGLQTVSFMTLRRRLLSDSDVRAVTGERRYVVDTHRALPVENHMVGAYRSRVS